MFSLEITQSLNKFSIITALDMSKMLKSVEANWFVRLDWASKAKWVLNLIAKEAQYNDQWIEYYTK